jgi:hypothetical protein
MSDTSKKYEQAYELLQIEPLIIKFKIYVDEYLQRYANAYFCTLKRLLIDTLC